MLALILTTALHAFPGQAPSGQVPDDVEDLDRPLFGVDADIATQGEGPLLPVKATPAAEKIKRHESSVQAFTDDIVQALQNRAREEGLKGAIRLLVDDVRGLDVTKVRSTLLPRIRRSLKKGDGPLKDGAGLLRVTIALSEERGHLWCVLVVEGPDAPPSTVVVETVIDRELEVALGAVSRQSTGRFVLERMGPLPVIRAAAGDDRRCPVLDTSMIDVDGDPVLELAVLTPCGVSVFRLDNSEIRQVGKTLPLPGLRWPRVMLGWLVTIDGDRFASRDEATLGPILWAATSAGHSHFVDVRGGRVVEAPRDRVPLSGVVTEEGPHALHWRFGTPVLTLPLVSPGGIDLLVQGLPMRLRDLARVPGRDAWVFITEDGALMARDDEGQQETLSPERVGDRFLLVDLDGDGDAELITSSAASPGEADQLVVRRLDAALSSSTVLLKSPLGGGSVVSITPGFVDFDTRLDVVVVEESGDEDMVWRLEHAP